MGLLNALVGSAERFRDVLLPVGYAERDVTCIINIDPSGERPPTVQTNRKSKFSRNAPASPADRTSGKVSPTLLVDKPSYALGIPDSRKKGNTTDIAQKEHAAFKKLLCEAANKTENKALGTIASFVAGTPGLASLLSDPKSIDLVTFELGSTPRPTDDAKVQAFWSAYVEQRLGEDDQVCVACGRNKPITRIMPFKVTLLKGTDPVQLSSFNEDAFRSLGKRPAETTDKGAKKKKAGTNAALCYACASVAGQVLQHLLKLDRLESGDERLSGRHAAVLTRDDSKGKSKQPLRNQIAVFWTKEPVEIDGKDKSVSLEEAVRKLHEEDEEVIDRDPPADARQIRDLLEAPWKGGVGMKDLAVNRFYLAVLSPNRSRLVVREWLEHDVATVRARLSRYTRALQIIHPEGRGVWWPPLPAVLQALRSYTSAGKKTVERPRLPQLGPDVVRQVIRCMYTGTAPPESLLFRATRCFRVPDPPSDNREERERQMLRRMAMAAAMKLVLTYHKSEQEQRAMEELHTTCDGASDYKQQAPYQCGRLLAILEAIQRRASSSGRGVNTTLVDRFYGSASTAPATVFANLVNMTTKAHLPKLRRENKELFRVRSSHDETVNINDVLVEACDAINEAGGFPPPLTPEEQAQFALGFYHQRAEFALPRQTANRSKSASIQPQGDEK